MATDRRSGAWLPDQLLRLVESGLREEGVLGAQVIGSVARRTATTASDVDVLAVIPEPAQTNGFVRSKFGETLVERVAKTEEQWLEHLRGVRPRWVYSFLDDGEILFDNGAIARLRAAAKVVYRDFVTPNEVRHELASLLWHGRAKVERAVASDDPQQAAYWAALLLPTLIDVLLALGNRPTAPGSRRLDVLASIQVNNDDAALLATTMTGLPFDRIRAAQRLAESLLSRLGDFDLERIDS